MDTITSLTQSLNPCEHWKRIAEPVDSTATVPERFSPHGRGPTREAAPLEVLMDTFEGSSRK